MPRHSSARALGRLFAVLVEIAESEQPPTTPMETTAPPNGCKCRPGASRERGPPGTTRPHLADLSMREGGVVTPRQLRAPNWSL